MPHLYKLKRLIIFVRGYGVPTEETVLIPVFFFIAMARAFDTHRLNVGIAGSATTLVWCICGIWLGIASKGPYALKVTLRVWLMAILSVAGYGAITETSYPKEKYVSDLGAITSNLGFLFYACWFFGSTLCGVLFTSITEKQKLIAARRKASIKLILMELLSLREDQMRWEIVFGKLLKWTVPLLLPLILLYASSKGWTWIIKFMAIFNIPKQP